MGKKKKKSSVSRRRRPTRPTPKPRPAKRFSIWQKLQPSSITLLEGKGSKGTGGEPGGQFWHIFCEDKRTGRIFINLINKEPFGKHASIQIYLNKPFHGKGIGRVAYRLACENSGYNEVYAYMRKSNVASIRAALAAGFEIVEHRGVEQFAMRWRRNR